MIPVIALVGRPNVGKSTLFNFLTKTRDALVADFPGLTRDRKYGHGKVGGSPYLVIDTGGLSGESEAIDELMAQQTRLAIDEADVVLFLVDARNGVTASDHLITSELRQINKPVILVVNKIDGVNADTAVSDFYELGMGEPLAIAAGSRGRGVLQLMKQAIEKFPLQEESESGNDSVTGIKVAILGRPNVGKSTLVNRLIGEDRVLAFDMPGTTRDSIYIPFEKNGQAYTLIDTAGVRRRSKVHEAIEKFSVIKALKAIEESNVVIIVLDAQQEISDQDATLLGFVLETGRALLLAVNKWDNLQEDQKEKIKNELDYKLTFLDFAEIHFISALHGTGIGHLFDSVQKAYESATRNLSTPQLTDILERAIEDHQPPLVKGRRIKLRYAHQGGRNPPVIVLHGNQAKSTPESYKRYLMNTYRKVLKLVGTPVRIEFKEGKNPFEGKRSKTSERRKPRNDVGRQTVKSYRKKNK
ncbi:MAG: ribosome biogenesis GTPase Der [Gammaproteobacteria bacterium]|nr:ribosome biogenesis GTPase Der [Gammaproteobacteria bacterium]